jgi:hypothetical protein
MATDEEKVFAGCAAGVIIAIAIPALFFLDLFILRQLWHWYAVPLDLPMLSYRTALGLSLFIGFFQHNNYDTKEGEEWKLWIRLFAKRFLTLVIGWLGTFLS